jgi:superfamily II DNA or RNA helicase
LIELRPYQQRGIEQLRQVIGTLAPDRRKVILVSPTASGKTVIASHIIKSAVDKGKFVLCLAHRRELIQQFSNKLNDYGVRHGVILAGERNRADVLAPVQVASKDTLYSRSIRKEVMSLPAADLVVCDEAHRSTGGKTWLSIIKQYPQAVLLGLTATPSRANGKQLGDIWNALVEVASYKELIELGALVKTRVFAPSRPDLKGVKTVGDDYDRKELARRMDKTRLVGDIFRTWEECASERPTVIFASGVLHSRHLQERFQAKGVETEHLDGKTDPWLRDEILYRLGNGEVRVVSNVGVLTEGWDCPPVSCAVLARPTKSLTLYRQMAGRIQRPAPGKDDALIIDHSGAIYQHGFPDDDIPWHLDKSTKPEQEQRRKEREHKLVVCPDCGHAYEGALRCPHCGAPRPTPKPKAVASRKGQLKEVSRAHALAEASQEDKQKSWDKAMWIAIGKKSKIGAAAHIYKDQYGVYPRHLDRLPKGKQWQMDAREFYDTHIAGETHAQAH